MNEEAKARVGPQRHRKIIIIIIIIVVVVVTFRLKTHTLNFFIPISVPCIFYYYCYYCHHL